MEKFDPVRTTCEICDSENIRLNCTDYMGKNIYICRNCSVQFLNPSYSVPYLANIYFDYSKTYSKTVDDGCSYTDEILDIPEKRHYCYNYYFSIIEKFCMKPGRLLDVGCGMGHFLSVGKERGWKPIGYDLDQDVCQKVRENTGLEILTGDFLDLNLQENSFSLVSMIHVIEHLKSPLLYFEKIRDLLVDGGIFFVAMPNINSVSSKTKFYLEKSGLRRKNKGKYYGTDHHLWFYSYASIKYLLEKFGFRVLFRAGGHRVKEKDSRFIRLFRRRVLERVLWNSQFFVISRKSKLPG